MTPHGMQIPWMMSLLRQPVIVIYIGQKIQSNTIAPYTRRFLTLSYKIPNSIV